MANKARGPPGPRALLASIPSPLNSQLGNTGSISHLTSRNNQLIQLANISSITQSAILSAILETLNQLFILHLPPGSRGVWSCDVKLRDFLFQINLRATRLRLQPTEVSFLVIFFFLFLHYIHFFLLFLPQSSIYSRSQEVKTGWSVWTSAL